MGNKGRIMRWCAISLIFAPCVRTILQRWLGINEG